MSQPTNAPTQKQLRYLRQLASRTGQTFATPRTRAQASSEIRRLRRQRPSSRGEVRAERRAIAREMAERPGGGAALRADEIAGYGSNARWATSSTTVARQSGSECDPAEVSSAGAPVSGTRGGGKPHALAGYRVGGQRRLIVVQRIRGVIRVGDLPACGKGGRYLLADGVLTCGELDALLRDYAMQAARLGVIPATPDGIRRALDALR